MRVTTNEVINMVKSVKGSTMITLETETLCDMNKTNNPFYGAIKKSVVNGQVGFYYDNAVNNQRGREEKEMDFTSQKPKWAVATDCKGIVTNQAGTKFYLYIKILSAESPTYFFNGREVSKDNIAPYLKEHKKPHTQANIEKEVVVRMYSIENIKKVKMFGNEYEVTELPVADKVEKVVEEKVEA
jgi:hypothetical protein